MSLNKILDSVSEDLSQVEEAILQCVQTDIPLLTHIAEYILAAGGKRLRPALVLLSAKLFDYNDQKTIKAAQVVEYLHTATLLHDDVVDKADMRRSQKAARSIWGNEASVLVGDYLFSMVFQMLTQLKNLEVLEVMSHTTTLMAKGELLQLTRPYTSVNEEDYIEIIISKTACLFASALKIGAVLAQAPRSEQQQLYDYGMAIGLAFQVVDDALDYMKEESQTGKSIGIDLKERKITLPLIHLLKEASPKDKSRLDGILSEKIINNGHVQEVVQMMENYGSTKYSIQVARNYANDAQNCLLHLPTSPIRQMLTDIANFIVIRHS
ncbi:MAG: polyprenyl synthetase family protein [SAR324 cluster bacterium]|nr:polyprenyl synthetase family protein [SAR324 cluster bacterium]